MNWDTLCWTEITIAVPLVGAVVTIWSRAPRLWCLGFALVTLACSAMPWLVLNASSGEGVWHLFPGLGRPLFGVDRLSGPLLPLVALLHVLTVLSAPRIESGRGTLGLLLAGEAVQLATFACAEPWPLAVLLGMGAVPVLVELARQREPIRPFAVHMSLFVVLLAIGVAVLGAMPGTAAILLMLAILVRSGTFPVHLWVTNLLDRAPLGPALLFVTPLIGVYAGVRLILPSAPDEVLRGIGLASLVTAAYAAGMASAQRDARRLLAYLFLSHSSLVLIGLELHTVVSLTGTLCLWVSVTLSLTGMVLTLRALEARFGRLSLARHNGLYGQSPALAVCFLLTGLACIGFPGTLGFVGAELLADGAVEASPLAGVGMALTAMVNGITVLRAYLLLFTGTRSQPAATLEITTSERLAVFALAGLILGGGLYPGPGVADRHAVAEDLLRRRNEGPPERVPLPQKARAEH